MGARHPHHRDHRRASILYHGTDRSDRQHCGRDPAGEHGRSRRDDGRHLARRRTDAGLCRVQRAVSGGFRDHRLACGERTFRHAAQQSICQSGELFRRRDQPLFHRIADHAHHERHPAGAYGEYSCAADADLRPHHGNLGDLQDQRLQLAAHRRHRRCGRRSCDLHYRDHAHRDAEIQDDAETHRPSQRRHARESDGPQGSKKPTTPSPNRSSSRAE